VKPHEISKNPVSQKRRSDQDLDDLIRKFKIEPIRSAAPLLRLKRQDAIEKVLADDDLSHGCFGRASANVRFWHKADMPIALVNVRFRHPPQEQSVE
jgi:hypothetical protein